MNKDFAQVGQEVYDAVAHVYAAYGKVAGGTLTCVRVRNDGQLDNEAFRNFVGPSATGSAGTYYVVGRFEELTAKFSPAAQISLKQDAAHIAAQDAAVTKPRRALVR